MNIILYPSESISNIHDFVQFNSLEHETKSWWNNDLYDFSLLDVKNTVIIIDFNILIDTITTPDSLHSLVECLDKNNHLLVANDIDGIYELYHTECKLEDIDKLLSSTKITLILDGIPLNNFKYKNIRMLSAPNSNFEKTLPRKNVLCHTHSKKDYILTMGRQRLHRDILWKILTEKQLLDKGFSIYHKEKNLSTIESKWIGSKNIFHDWQDGHPSIELYNNSNFEIVPETFCKDAYFITEKTIKPISYNLPFVVVSTPGYLEFLRSKGYKTFDGIINESYDYEYDLEKRIELVVEQVEYIIKSGSDNFYKKASDVTKHNFDNLARISGSWWAIMDEFYRKVITDYAETIDNKDEF
jgi:hypothetical protein